MSFDESSNGVGMTGYRTTFHDMFSAQREGTPQVVKVEVPLIQRDYAQGREDAKSTAIRGTFLDALHDALTTETSVGLDFIYGEVRDGTFEPLDGQQRLTTLFLLHWYIAFRRNDLSDRHPWTKFSYATRPSARLFSERIVKNPPPSDMATPPSEWIVDQSWYLHQWRFDPTIRAMLVTLDAIAVRFAAEDIEQLWARLTDGDAPAIWFQLLPIDEMGSAEDLYIKMNSRGKPLTEFEAFKAYLGQLVAETGGFEEFGHKIDGEWTDLLWPYRGDNNIVDDEFMRYFDFLIEVCEWREDRFRDEAASTPEQRVRALLSTTNPRHLEHLGFICEAFQTWVGGETIEAFFNDLFTTSQEGEGLRLFGANATRNLFQACCDRYGVVPGATRPFSLTDTLLLHAVLVHKMHNTENVADRLRSLRNVNEASQFEMRLANMPKFVEEVEAFMRSGDLSDLVTFNKNQVTEEKAKRQLRIDRPHLVPSLTLLEDHAILRGTLAAFDLDDSLESRAPAFVAAFAPDLWPVVTGSLLACGEYQRNYPNSDHHRFGSPTTDSVWRLMFVDRGDRDVLAPVRAALGALLDRIGSSEDEVLTTLEFLSREFTEDRAARAHYDWRYHLVRYPEMREGNSGIYFGADQRLGYEMTMLRKTVQSSYYRDAYLYGAWSQAGRPGEVKDPWFYGYSTAPRWMELSRSLTALRSIAPGIAIREPKSASDRALLADVCERAGAVHGEEGWMLPIPQQGPADDLVDSVDRVQAAAKLLQDLIAAGL